MDNIFGIDKDTEKKKNDFFKEVNDLKLKHTDILEEKDTFTNHIIFKYPNNDSLVVGFGFNDIRLPILPQYIKDEIALIFYKHYPKI